MTAKRLLIRPSGRLGTDTFAWRGTSGQSSFHTNLDPELRCLGEVPLPHQDLVAFGMAVFLADRTTPRPKSWRRSIELPVYDPYRWTRLAPDLAQTLDMLSADDWQLSFAARKPRKPLPVADHPHVDRALLFSGGADSLCGAIRALATGEKLLLVSHWDWAGHASVQKMLTSRLARHFPKQVVRHQLHLARRQKQIGGRAFGNEPTRRTRSLLFVALGLAEASVEPSVPLWIAENGYAALNPPLAGERRGALSTRTTHPLVLARLHSLVTTIGGQADFTNPFAFMTKGEMYADAASTLGADAAASILSTSHSCSHVRFAIGTGFSPDTQCGVCFGCLVRRAAFLAADLSDTTTYLHAVIPTKSQPRHLARTAAAEIGTVRYAGRRGVKVTDLLAMGLPPTFNIEAALDVAQRGLAELAQVVNTLPDLKRVA